MKESKERKQKPRLMPAGEVQPEAAIEQRQPTIDELRFELARKLSIFVSDWTRCERRLCRRNRACSPPADVYCDSPRPVTREVTPEEEAASKAWLARELKRRLGRA